MNTSRDQLERTAPRAQRRSRLAIDAQGFGTRGDEHEEVADARGGTARRR
jgi:hypothetical protein